ncbi:MAG: tRNA (adenosine(37)-N6)-threonylcarbamoyltransferase complex ATPase subunit type 1 TsaE [Isosphaeraceae bacterium]
MRLESTQDGLAIDLESEEETDRLAVALAELAEPGTVIGLEGPLGAGKTRFSQAFAEALGVDRTLVTSPTFVLIHEYQGRLPVYHFDAYRLDDPDDFEALGVADYWDAGGICLVEWADRVAELLPQRRWWLRFVPRGERRREVLLRGVNATDLSAGLTRSNTSFDRRRGQS